MKIRLFTIVAMMLLAMNMVHADEELGCASGRMSHFYETYHRLTSKKMTDDSLQARDALLAKLFAELDKKSNDWKQIDDDLRDFLLQVMQDSMSNIKANLPASIYEQNFAKDLPLSVQLEQLEQQRGDHGNIHILVDSLQKILDSIKNVQKSMRLEMDSEHGFDAYGIDINGKNYGDLIRDNIVKLTKMICDLEVIVKEKSNTMSADWWGSLKLKNFRNVELTKLLATAVTIMGATYYCYYNYHVADVYHPIQKDSDFVAQHFQDPFLGTGENIDDKGSDELLKIVAEYKGNIDEGSCGADEIKSEEKIDEISKNFNFFIKDLTMLKEFMDITFKQVKNTYPLSSHFHGISFFAMASSLSPVISSMEGRSQALQQSTFTDDKTLARAKMVSMLRALHNYLMAMDSHLASFESSTQNQLGLCNSIKMISTLVVSMIIKINDVMPQSPGVYVDYKMLETVWHRSAANS